VCEEGVGLGEVDGDGFFDDDVFSGEEGEGGEFGVGV